MMIASSGPPKLPHALTRYRIKHSFQSISSEHPSAQATLGVSRPKGLAYASVRPSVRPYPIIIISLRVHTIRNRIKRKRKGKSFPQTTSTHPPTHPRCCWARFNLAYCIHSLLSQRLMQLTKKKNSEGDESLAINRSWHCSPQPGGGRRGGGLFDIAINKMERRRTSSSSSSS